MKKTVSILLLALCLCLAQACAAGGPAAAPTAAPETEGDSVVEDSGTDVIMPPDGVYTEESATDTAVEEPAEGFASLAAEDCIEDALPREGVLPRITLDCDGARQINQQLEEKFIPISEDPICEQLYYMYSKGADRVLSIVMEEHWPNDCVYYTAYNLDLETGQALTGPELLALLGVDEAELRNLEQALMGREFTNMYGDMQADIDPDFYDGQYERTTSPDNTETDQLWISGDGQLCFAGRIYSMAGAEYYEYQIGTGWVF